MVPEFARTYDEPVNPSEVTLLLAVCYHSRGETTASSITGLGLTISRRALASAPKNDRWLEDLRALRAA